MANPYMVQMGRPLTGAVQNFMMGQQFAQQRAAQQAQQQMQAQTRELAPAALMGDPQAMAQLASVNPQAAAQVQQSLAQQQRAKQEQAQFRQTQATEMMTLAKEGFADLAKIESPQDKQKFLQQMENQMKRQFGDQSYTELGPLVLQNILQQQPELQGELIAMQEAVAAPDVDAPQFQQGTGVMTGYSFDPTTGQFAISPEIKQQLETKAAEKAAKDEEFSVKDMQGINKDVTTLLKAPTAVNTSYDKLKSLAKVDSPAAQVGIIFEFMKSLDPTSVVRESEQGMVASASGPMSYFASQLNRITGGGPLTAAMTQDILNAAGAVAETANTAAATELNDYLGAYGDKLPDEFKQRLINRVPEFKPFVPEADPDEPPESGTAAAPRQPRVIMQIPTGTVEGGHVFMGGDPGDEKNWRRIGY